VPRLVWQRIIALLAVASVVVLAPRIPLWPRGDAAMLWDVALTAGWIAVSWTLIRGVRAAGLHRLREQPAERQGLVNVAIQILSGALVLVVAGVVADIWHVSLAGIALGGAVTGVIVGLAAQSTLGNVFAGVQLLVLRPLRVGEWVSLRSWMTGIDLGGRVEEINFFYTVLRDGDVRRVIPNAAVTAATLTVDDVQSTGVHMLALPYRIAPEEAMALLAPYRRAQVAELRVDGYSLRVEWPADDSAWAERCSRVAAHLRES
jgi:small conductance mechanosensitive channel